MPAQSRLKYLSPRALAGVFESESARVDGWVMRLLSLLAGVQEALTQRLVALLAFSESVIAVLVGFNHVDWSAEQTSLVMALVSTSLGVMLFSERREMRQQIALHELAAAEAES
jgi:hypothetical protein